MKEINRYIVYTEGGFIKKRIGKTRFKKELFKH